MERLAGWRTELTKVIEANRRREFAWSEFDCAIWCKIAVKAQTEIDIIPDIEGTYSDAKGAAKSLRGMGFASLPALCNHYFGPRQHIALARPGDIVVAPKDIDDDRDGLFGRSLGICNGPQSLFVSHIDDIVGLVGFHTLDLQYCYRV